MYSIVHYCTACLIEKKVLIKLSIVATKYCMLLKHSINKAFALLQNFAFWPSVIAFLSLSPLLVTYGTSLGDTYQFNIRCNCKYDIKIPYTFCYKFLICQEICHTTFCQWCDVCCTLLLNHKSTTDAAVMREQSIPLEIDCALHCSQYGLCWTYEMFF